MQPYKLFAEYSLLFLALVIALVDFCYYNTIYGPGQRNPVVLNNDSFKMSNYLVQINL